MNSTDGHLYCFNGKEFDESALTFKVQSVNQLEKNFGLDVAYTYDEDGLVSTFNYFPFTRPVLLGLNFDSEREACISKVSTLMGIHVVCRKSIQLNIKYFAVATQFEKLYYFAIRHLRSNESVQNKVGSSSYYKKN